MTYLVLAPIMNYDSLSYALNFKMCPACCCLLQEAYRACYVKLSGATVCMVGRWSVTVM